MGRSRAAIPLIVIVSLALVLAVFWYVGPPSPSTGVLSSEPVARADANPSPVARRITNESNRRDGFGRQQPGARTRVPRFQIAQTADAGAPRPASGRQARQLASAKGPLTDRRPSPGPNAAAEIERISLLLGTVQDRAQECLMRQPHDESLEQGMMLGFDLDEAGLQDVWVADRTEIPTGPLRCLSEAIYQMDWAGLTRTPVMVTRRVRYATPDAAPAQAERN
jgi:hypothetical protein